MKYYVPVKNNTPYQTFSVQLSGRMLTIKLRWLSNFGYYAIDVLENKETITLGRGLNPQMDIFAGLNIDMGRLYLSGEQPTLSNLGVRNRLVYDE